MAALQNIKRQERERTEIKVGDIVTVDTRGEDHLHIVTRVYSPNKFCDAISLVNGSSVQNNVTLFKGTVEIYNVL